MNENKVENINEIHWNWLNVNYIKNINRNQCTLFRISLFRVKILKLFTKIYFRILFNYTER
jgi:hypothetical protein